MRIAIICLAVLVMAGISGAFTVNNGVRIRREANETESGENETTSGNSGESGSTSSPPTAQGGSEPSASAPGNSDPGASTSNKKLPSPPPADPGNNGSDGEDGNQANAKAAEATKGKGAKNDDEGLDEDKDEPTTVNDKGVVIYPSTNQKPQQEQSDKEAAIQESQFDQIVNGEDLKKAEQEDDEGPDDTEDDTTSDKTPAAASSGASSEVTTPSNSGSGNETPAEENEEESSSRKRRSADESTSGTEESSSDPTDNSGSAASSEATTTSPDSSSDTTDETPTNAGDISASSGDASSSSVTTPASTDDAPASSDDTTTPSSDTSSSSDGTSPESSEETSETSENTSSSSNDTTSEGSAPTRRKRLALKNPSLRWPEATFPYTFKKGTKKNIRLEAKAAMGYLSRHTCMKFVPYKNGKANKKLGHPGHLVFEGATGSYCFSFIGLLRKASGQKIACSQRFVFIHELGHAAFLVHEQNGENREGLVRINFENIREDKLKQYRQLPEEKTLNSTGYDVSSINHYGLTINSKNGKQTMSVLYEAPEMHVSGHMYYTAAEINKGYMCESLVCPDMKVKCQKDSYAVKKGDTCTCQCTPGIDASTGCTRPKTSRVPVDNWGPGKVAILKPVDGCPEGMSDGQWVHTGDGTSRKSGVYHLAADLGNGPSSTIPLCITEGGTGTWPPGQYCLVKIDACPKGFFSSSYKIGDAGGSPVELLFCCRTDGFDFEEVQMVNKAPMTLFRKNHVCQNIEDMYAYKEYFILDSAGPVKKRGQLPSSYVYTPKYTLKLDYCYYVPINYGGGDSFDLTPESKTASFEIPQTDGKYSPSTMYTFLVEASEDKSHIVLDFDDESFCLGKGDHVDIHNNKIGQPSLRVTGIGYKPSVITLGPMLKVQFKSDKDDECTGFKATVRMVTKEEQAYDVNDYGASYRGKVSFTHNRIPCKHWTSATACPHHPFAIGDFADGLEENYCRNPGNGVAPWCYVSLDNCERNYCDVSMFGRVADNFPDCEDILRADPTYCDDVDKAVRGCAKTCADKIKVDLKPKKVGEISCSKPDEIDGAQIEDAKDSYKLGEKVLYKCSSGPGELVRVCGSDGQWSPGGYVCGDCDAGWEAFGGYCYKYFDKDVVYKKAVKSCRDEGASLLSIKSEEEQNFVEKITTRQASTQWLGMVRKGKSRKYLWIDDKSTVRGFTKWAKKHPQKKVKVKNAFLSSNVVGMEWKTIRAMKKRPFFAYTCKKPAGQRPCVDRLPNCEALLKAVPEACENFTHTGFTEQQCRKSCGVCGSVTCNVPAAGPNAVLVTQESSVKAGDVINYECDDGYMLKTGSLKLACMGSGQLSDAAPECVDKSTVVRPSNDNDIRPRSGVFGHFRTYTGHAPQWRIDAAGKVIAWEFQLVNAGTSVFQVWRPTEDPSVLTFVGQNEISATHYRPHTVPIPADEQIEVQNDDRIAIWNPYPTFMAGIPFDIYKSFTEGGLKMKQSVNKKDQFIAGQTYEFVEDSPLKIISFKAILGPA